MEINKETVKFDLFGLVKTQQSFKMKVGKSVIFSHPPPELVLSSPLSGKNIIRISIEVQMKGAIGVEKAVKNTLVGERNCILQRRLASAPQCTNW